MLKCDYGNRRDNNIEAEWGELMNGEKGFQYAQDLIDSTGQVDDYGRNHWTVAKDEDKASYMLPPITAGEPQGPDDITWV